jgi:rhodanese-related sulfurtransferase
LFDTTQDSIAIPVDSIISEPIKTEIQKDKEIEKRNTPEKVGDVQTTKTDEPVKEEKELQTFSEPKAVTLEQAFKLFENGVDFVDARDEGDFLAGHITKSINIPFDDFDNHKQKLDQLSKDKPMVIYCAGTDCDLSILLGNLLFEMGYKKIYVFFGGWNDWLDAKYPVDYPQE